MDYKKAEAQMFDVMWGFLSMGKMKSNYPQLKKFCLDLRQMMMQKTAGQRKDKPKDISFDDLPRIKNSIVCEAMALVLSGDLEPDHIPTLAERDRQIEGLWEQFSDVPMNPNTECIEESFLGFKPGTNRLDIWHWFDDRYSKGVAALLYGGDEKK